MSMTDTDDREAEAKESEWNSEPTQRVATLHASRAEGPVEIRAFGATEVGLVREHNEDNFAFADLASGETSIDREGIFSTTLGDRGFVAAVCDGMGGAAAGEVASQMGIDTVLEILASGEPAADRDDFARRLVDAIQEAGTRIFGAAKMDRTRRGMGTTSTVAGLVDKVLFVGQVGDSRAYVLRDGELGLVTKDQSLVNQLIEAGQLSEEEAESFEHSNIILQALGTTERVVVDLTFLELRRGDRLMLCSDGLSGLVHASAIRDVLTTVRDPEEAAQRLIEMSNTAGGHDNITCVIVDFEGEGLPPAVSGDKPSYQPYPLPAGEDGGEAGGARREPTVKTSTQKPGADVKKRGADGKAAPRAGAASDKNPLFGFVIALIVAVVAAMAFGLFSGEEKKPVRRGEPERAVAQPVDVLVTSDVTDGELYIDGKLAGQLAPDQTTVLELAPGAYRFEVRVEDTMVKSSFVTVRAGRGEEKVDLSMPSGVSREDEAGEVEPPAEDDDTGAADEAAPEAGGAQGARADEPAPARDEPPAAKQPERPAEPEPDEATPPKPKAGDAAGETSSAKTPKPAEGGEEPARSGDGAKPPPAEGASATEDEGGAPPPAAPRTEEDDAIEDEVQRELEKLPSE